MVSYLSTATPRRLKEIQKKIHSIKEKFPFLNGF